MQCYPWRYPSIVPDHVIVIIGFGTIPALLLQHSAGACTRAHTDILVTCHAASDTQAAVSNATELMNIAVLDEEAGEPATSTTTAAGAAGAAPAGDMGPDNGKSIDYKASELKHTPHAAAAAAALPVDKVVAKAHQTAMGDVGHGSPDQLPQSPPPPSSSCSSGGGALQEVAPPGSPTNSCPLSAEKDHAASSGPLPACTSLPGCLRTSKHAASPQKGADKQGAHEHRTATSAAELRVPGAGRYKSYLGSPRSPDGARSQRTNNANYGPAWTFSMASYGSRTSHGGSVRFGKLGSWRSSGAGTEAGEGEQQTQSRPNVGPYLKILISYLQV